MKKLSFHIFLFALLPILFTACRGYNPSSEVIKTKAPEIKVVEDVDLAQFKALMADGRRIILDVRTPEEVAAGSIPGAMNIDYRSADFGKRITQELDVSKEYLVYCKSGGRSSKAAAILEKSGVRKAYNLLGGYTAWAAAQ